MSQRIVETIIGRLITDEQFRSEFLSNPRRVLENLKDLGFSLNPTEVDALLNTDSTLWAIAADAMDPRLQKVSLRNDGNFQSTKRSNP